MAEAKREDKYEPPGIVTPPGIIKYKKHEVRTRHATLPHHTGALTELCCLHGLM